MKKDKYAEAYYEGFALGKEDGRKTGEQYGRCELARKMFFLIEAIADAAEYNNVEKRWALINIAKDVLAPYYSKNDVF